MKASTPKTKLGRPRTGKEVAVALTARIPAELVCAVEAWARDHGVTRSEAVARLLAQALAKGGAKGKR